MKNSNADWMSKRLKCNQDDVFVMIRDQIVRDVNTLNGSQRDSDKTGIELIGEDSDHNFRMSRASINSEKTGIDLSKRKNTVEVMIKDNKVIANKYFDQEQLEIKTEWLIDKGRCVLMVNDEKMKVWQISQRIIENLLYPWE